VGLTVTLQATVLAWSERTRRDLPWRRTRDPWAVLVSELMLQQTQVARVLPRYPLFLDRFPDAASCAAAATGAVVEAWAGLGYNRRAVYLHRAALAIVEDHGGHVPDRLEQLTALPGIGPYTARAVLAFAFEYDHGLVETNVARVLARAICGQRLTARQAQSCADGLVPEGQAWAWNQAMVDLGATICVSRGPRCEQCPLAEAGMCAYLRQGRRPPDPARGSAGTSSPQSTFAGSDRQGRGRLVDALRRGPVPWDGLAAAAGWPEDPARAARVVAGLVADGLAVGDSDNLGLPTAGRRRPET
jgi:A/G-specific adenine glycosylase